MLISPDNLEARVLPGAWAGMNVLQSNVRQTPHGNAPTLNHQQGLLVVMGDTSYSDMSA